MGRPAGNNGEHASQQIARDVKEGGLPGLLLLCGEEPYLIRWALGLVEDACVPGTAQSLDITRLAAESTDMDEILRCCETLPMLSQRRIVEVAGLPADLSPAEGLEGLPESCVLIFILDGSPSSAAEKALEKKIRESGSVYKFSVLDEKLLAGFIGKRLREAGKTIHPQVAARIARESGYLEREGAYRLGNLHNDLLKMAAHAPGSEITQDDVSACLAQTLESNAFALLDAVSKNRKDEAFRLLHDLLRNGENVYRILTSLASQMELLLCVKEMRQEGKSPAEIQSLLKVHEFRIRKALAFSEKYSTRDLKRVLRELCQVDRRIKSGFLEQETALEMFIASI
jgi:DNA polymerase-3 subunit delta